VLMDHALRHRAQNADVATTTPKIAAQRGAQSRKPSAPTAAIDDPDPDEA